MVSNIILLFQRWWELLSFSLSLSSAMKRGFHNHPSLWRNKGRKIQFLHPQRQQRQMEFEITKRETYKEDYQVLTIVYSLRYKKARRNTIPKLKNFSFLKSVINFCVLFMADPLQLIDLCNKQTLIIFQRDTLVIFQSVCLS